MLDDEQLTKKDFEYLQKMKEIKLLCINTLSDTNRNFFICLNLFLFCICVMFLLLHW